MNQDVQVTCKCAVCGQGLKLPISAFLLVQYAPPDEEKDFLTYKCFVCGTENMCQCDDSLGQELVLANVCRLNVSLDHVRGDPIGEGDIDDLMIDLWRLEHPAA